MTQLPLAERLRRVADIVRRYQHKPAYFGTIDEIRTHVAEIERLAETLDYPRGGSTWHQS